MFDFSITQEDKDLLHY